MFMLAMMHEQLACLHCCLGMLLLCWHCYIHSFMNVCYVFLYHASTATVGAEFSLMEHALGRQHMHAKI